LVIFIFYNFNKLIINLLNKLNFSLISSFRVKGSFTSFLKNIFITSRVRVYLDYTYNIGSLLAILVFIQLISGLILVLYYIPESSMSFGRIQYICREVHLG
jgi:quinol-cytochrome oxidoreductase complex cytochrome b subunit